MSEIKFSIFGKLLNIHSKYKKILHISPIKSLFISILMMWDCGILCFVFAMASVKPKEEKLSRQVEVGEFYAALMNQGWKEN
jgi:hypothetical protein